jgi:drug/metabolite transporter (DMT)-like permease
MSYLGSITLVIVSLVGYQLAQRSVSARGNAWAPLLAAYVVGAVICGAAFFLSSRSQAAGVRAFSLGSLVLGLSVVGIEFGYLQAHRAGWNLATVGLVGSAGGSLVLALVSAFFFQEPLTPRQMVGIGCCLIGLALITLGR